MGKRKGRGRGKDSLKCTRVGYTDWVRICEVKGELIVESRGWRPKSWIHIVIYIFAHLCCVVAVE